MNIKKDDSELYTLKGFILMMKIAIDPAGKGATLSGVCSNALEKAHELDAQNPRALLLMGQMSHGTAQFFGQSTEQACNLVKESIALFKNENREGTLLPTWGLYNAEGWLQESCQ